MSGARGGSAWRAWAAGPRLLIGTAHSSLLRVWGAVETYTVVSLDDHGVPPVCGAQVKETSLEDVELRDTPYAQEALQPGSTEERYE